MCRSHRPEKRPKGYSEKGEPGRQGPGTALFLSLSPLSLLLPPHHGLVLASDPRRSLVLLQPARREGDQGRPPQLVDGETEAREASRLRRELRCSWRPRPAFRSQPPPLPPSLRGSRGGTLGQPKPRGSSRREDRPESSWLAEQGAPSVCVGGTGPQPPFCTTARPHEAAHLGHPRTAWTQLPESHQARAQGTRCRPMDPAAAPTAPAGETLRPPKQRLGRGIRQPLRPGPVQQIHERTPPRTSLPRPGTEPPRRQAAAGAALPGSDPFPIPAPRRIPGLLQPHQGHSAGDLRSLDPRCT